MEISYTCYTNKRRNHVKNDFFLQFVKQNYPEFNTNQAPKENVLIINDLVTKEGKDVGEDYHKCLWPVCGDDNMHDSNHQKMHPC
jgi:hypothetical protein